MSIWRMPLIVLGVLVVVPGTSVAVTIHVPTQEPTIQAGINAEGDGREFVVR